MANYSVKNESYAESVSNGQSVSKYYVTVTADTAADIPDPDPTWAPGSECRVLADGGSKYVLSNAGEWVEVPNFTGAGSSAPAGDTSDDGMLTAVIDGTATEIYSEAESVRAYGLQQYTNLAHVDLPNATELGTRALASNEALESVSIPSVVTIGGDAFYRCKALKSVNFPVLKTIGYTAFTGCSALSEVICPAVETLYEGAFESCKSLQKIDLPCAKLIDLKAFYGCSLLETVIIRSAEMCTLGDTSDILYQPFLSTKISSGTGYIYVPGALVSTYKTDANWATYANQIRAIEDYPDITGG